MGLGPCGILYVVGDAICFRVVEASPAYRGVGGTPQPEGMSHLRDTKPLPTLFSA